MPEYDKRKVDGAEWAASNAIGQLIISAAKRLRVLGEDSMERVRELAQYFVDMVERARRGKS